MKVGLILPGNIWFSPYVHIYTHVLEEKSIPYDIISWNRDGRDPIVGVQYQGNNELSGRFSKILPYFRYSNFIKKVVLAQKYDRLVVFGPQLAIFLSRFLKRYYKNKYIFDYRDLSIEQYKLLHIPFKRVLKYSVANFISSPGFKRCLPKGYKYYLSHNFNIEAVHSALNQTAQLNDSQKPICVLTIGGIRDYDANIEVVNALSNKDDFHLSFVGKGYAAPLIEQFANREGVQNIDFVGYYQKEEEASYIRNSTFLNIYYPKIISHETALSNRFYNALIYKKPMLVTSNSTQGDYVEKHQLGLAVNDCSKLDGKMRSWLQQTNQKAFAERCNALLREFVNDYQLFEEAIQRFVNDIK